MADKVDVQLERLIAAQRQTPKRLLEAVRYAVFSGGKRFRPLLVLGACEAVGGKPNRPQALDIACAVEFIHAYSLVHDDLPAMDNADARRGKPSCHRQYDEATAILVGDALLTLSFEVLSSVKTAHALEIIRGIAHSSGMTGLIGGQMLDLESLSHPERVSERMMRDIAQRKTAELINISVVAGAWVGGAGPAKVRRLEQYGMALGSAFQWVDDVHDQDGLVHKVGLEPVREEAQDLIQKALEVLRPFGERADVLRHLATWLGATV
jgi:geranylgeranyl diphosphate synthase type II